MSRNYTDAEKPVVLALAMGGMSVEDIDARLAALADQAFTRAAAMVRQACMGGGCRDWGRCTCEVSAGMLLAARSVKDGTMPGTLSTAEQEAYLAARAELERVIRERVLTQAARADAMWEMATKLRTYCPDHGSSEHGGFMDCHCPAADEIDRDASQVASFTSAQEGT